MIEQIKAIAKEWFKQGSIDYFIGFKQRSDNKSYPFKFTNAQEIEQLVFDDNCYYNLAAFLPAKDRNEKAGILLKGCDGKAFVQLLSENRLNRTDVKIVGIVCPGMSDGPGLKEKCKNCQTKLTPVYDELIGNPEAATNNLNPDFSDITEFEKLNNEERLNYFIKEFSKCRRCYACRQVCPICYCDECITAKTMPSWIESGIKTSSNLFFI